MRIRLQHAQSFGFKGVDLMGYQHQRTYYRYDTVRRLMFLLDDCHFPTDTKLWVLELSKLQAKLYLKNKLSVVPPGCCAPGAGDRKVVGGPWHQLFCGEVKGIAHLKSILELPVPSTLKHHS